MTIKNSYSGDSLTKMDTDLEYKQMSYGNKCTKCIQKVACDNVVTAIAPSVKSKRSYKF